MRSILADKPIYFTDAKDSCGACWFQTARWIWTSFGSIVLDLKRNLLRGNCVWEIQKVGMSFDDSQKLFLKGKTLNNYTSPNSVHIFFCQGWRRTTKFSMDMSDMCSRITGSSKIFESILSQNQGIREWKKRQKYPFWYFFNPLNYTLLKSLPIQTQT